jgi:hypothetical protein
MIVLSNLSAKALLATVTFFVTMAASSARTDMEDQCWPPGHPEYPVGLPEAVVGKASDFLLRAEGVPDRPYWPGGKSSITIGAGWDLGYHTVADLHKTWGELDAEALGRLETAAGKRGPAPHAMLGGLASVTVPRSLSLRVLNTSLKNDYRPLVIKLCPGTEKLPVEAQVVLISLAFNRGDAMGRDPDWLTAKQLDQPWEMRKMRDDVKRVDMYAMYAHLGIMKRLWEVPNQRGLRRRRCDEQALVRPLVNQQLKREEDRDRLKNSGRPPCRN